MKDGQMEKHAVITGSFAKEVDRFAINALGIPSLDLMERAALQLFCRAEELLQDKGQPVQIFCGTGNNGADGLLCGAMLLEQGHRAVTADCVGDPEKGSPEFSVQKDRFLSAGGVWRRFSGQEICDPQKTPEHSDEKNAGSQGQPVLEKGDQSQAGIVPSLVIDAVFGIGLKRKLEGDFLLAVRTMNAWHARGAYVLSVDIPSGIDADQGKNFCAPELPVLADETLTFGWAKAGHYLGYGYENCGTLKVCDIGYPEGILCRLLEAREVEQGGVSEQNSQKAEQKTAKKIGTAEGDCEGRRCLEAACEGELLYDTEAAFQAVRGAFQRRERRANKGTYGKLLILAGSPGMAGAAYLCGLSAYRCGAGMVKYIGTEKNRCILQTLLPEAMYEAYDPSGENSPEEIAGKVQAGTDWADLILIGPGLSQSQEARLLLEETLRICSAQEAQGAFAEKKTLIIDADALNLIAADPKLQKLVPKGAVLTPHVGELARLCGCSPKEAKEALSHKALQLAKRLQVTVAAKDCVTVVAEPGGRLWMNRTGSAALAKAGSGDVLAGFIAGAMSVLWADTALRRETEGDGTGTGSDGHAEGGRGVCMGSESHMGSDPEAALAVPAAVFLHGRSGALAAKRLGIHSTLARDIANGAGEAMNSQVEGKPERSSQL